MKKVSFIEAMTSKHRLINARREYNKENNTNITMADFLHNVLNYPADEAKKIRNKIYKKKSHPNDRNVEC